MAFIVEDGTGLSNSNSYVAVAEADTYFSINIHAVGWADFTNTEKENLLQLATRHLDTHVNWNGEKAVETSALRWPRLYVTDRDSVEISSSVVPKEVRWATAEMALFLSANDPAELPGDIGVSELVVDVIELVFDKNDRKPVVPPEVKYALKGLARFGNGSTRTGRLIPS